MVGDLNLDQAIKCETCTVYLMPGMRSRVCPHCQEKMIQGMQMLRRYNEIVDLADALIKQQADACADLSDAWSKYGELQAAAEALLTRLELTAENTGWVENYLPDDYDAGNEFTRLRNALKAVQELGKNASNDGTTTDLSNAASAENNEGSGGI